MNDLKIIAENRQGGQVFLKNDRYILAHDHVLVPTSVKRLAELRKTAGEVLTNFNHYDLDGWVFIQYEMIAFRFTEPDLVSFATLLEEALARIENRMFINPAGIRIHDWDPTRIKGFTPNHNRLN